LKVAPVLANSFPISDPQNVNEIFASAQRAESQVPHLAHDGSIRFQHRQFMDRACRQTLASLRKLNFRIEVGDNGCVFDIRNACHYVVLESNERPLKSCR
jgi:hypothetical protein